MTIDHDHMMMVPKSMDEFKYILGLFENGQSMTVTIEPLTRPVERSQMGLLHAYINYIHEETGEDKNSIKIHLKKMYGVRNDDGTLKSTSGYDTKEMGKLIDGTYIFMTQELGIHVPDPESFKQQNLK